MATRASGSVTNVCPILSWPVTAHCTTAERSYGQGVLRWFAMVDISHLRFQTDEDDEMGVGEDVVIHATENPISLTHLEQETE